MSFILILTSDLDRKHPFPIAFVGTKCTYPSYPPYSSVGPYQYRMSHIHLRNLLVATPYLFLRYRATSNYPSPGYVVLTPVATPSARKNASWRSVSEFAQHFPQRIVGLIATILAALVRTASVCISHSQILVPCCGARCFTAGAP